MKSIGKHLMDFCRKGLVMLLLAVFSLSAKKVRAQREINPWEPEFDSSYSMHKVLYEGLFKVKHYGEFYSNYMKEHRFTYISIRYSILNTDSITEKYIENNHYLYNKGLLLKHIKTGENDLDTIFSREYVYNNASNKLSVVIFENGKKVIRVVFNRKSQIELDNDYRIGLSSHYEYDKNGRIIRVETTYSDHTCDLLRIDYLKEQLNQDLVGKFPNEIVSFFGWNGLSKINKCRIIVYKSKSHFTDKTLYNFHRNYLSEISFGDSNHRVDNYFGVVFESGFMRYIHTEYNGPRILGYRNTIPGLIKNTIFNKYNDSVTYNHKEIRLDYMNDVSPECVSLLTSNVIKNYKENSIYFIYNGTYKFIYKIK